MSAKPTYLDELITRLEDGDPIDPALLHTASDQIDGMFDELAQLREEAAKVDKLKADNIQLVSLISQLETENQRIKVEAEYQIKFYQDLVHSIQKERDTSQMISMQNV